MNKSLLLLKCGVEFCRALGLLLARVFKTTDRRPPPTPLSTHHHDRRTAHPRLLTNHRSDLPPATTTHRVIPASGLSPRHISPTTHGSANCGQPTPATGDLLLPTVHRPPLTRIAYSKEQERLTRLHELEQRAQMPGQEPGLIEPREWHSRADSIWGVSRSAGSGCKLEHP